MKDALAPGDDEGRDKLRKAAPRGKYPIRSADVRMGQPTCRRGMYPSKREVNPGN